MSEKKPVFAGENPFAPKSGAVDGANSAAAKPEDTALARTQTEPQTQPQPEPQTTALAGGKSPKTAGGIKAQQKSKRRRHLIIAAVLVLVLIAGAFGIHFFTSSGAAGEADPTAVYSGDMGQVVRQDVTKSVSLTGTLQSTRSEVLYSTLNAKVKSVEVKAGDRVTKGQRLAQLDTTDIAQELASQEASLREAQVAKSNEIANANTAYQQALQAYNSGTSPDVSAAKRTLAEAQRAQARANQALQLAQQQAAANPGDAEAALRVTEARDAVTTAAENTADAQLGVQTAQRSARSQVDEAARTLQAAQAGASGGSDTQRSLEKLRQDLQNATVTSPIDGVVTAVSAKVGSAADGSLLTVEDDKNLLIRTSVKEKDVAKLHVGDKVTFTTPATQKQEYTGAVSFISPTAEATASNDNGGMNSGGSGGNEGASFQVEVKVTGQVEGLRIGSSVKAKAVVQSYQNALTVPKSALVDAMDPVGGEGSTGTKARSDTAVLDPAELPKAILKVEDDGKGNLTISEIPVEVLLSSQGTVAIRGQGLEEGMSVLLNAMSYQHLVGQSAHLTDTPPNLGEAAMMGDK